MGDGLGVGGDAVVLEGREVDVLGAEDGEDGLDSRDGGGGRAVADDDEGLVARVDVGAVEGVAGDDFDVGGEVALKSCDLGGLAGGLAADDGAELGCWRIMLDYDEPLVG